MVTMKSPELYMLPDKWGVITRDKLPAAHFEHTIAIHHGKADILSTFEEIETIEDVYEPFLMQLGFISRTPRGRIALEPAYKHMGIEFNK